MMHKWPPPSNNEQKHPSKHPLFSPTPDELRALVLDYLCHNSYTNTARAFVRDSAIKHLDADGDELMTPATSDESTIDRLAETLEERLAPAEARRDIRTYILSGRVDEATTLLNEHFPSVLSEEQQPLLGSRDTSSPDTFDYMPLTSVDPTHLALNLRIHAFIEAARTIPLPYYPPGTSLTHSLPSSSSSYPGIQGKLQVSGDEELDARHNELLHRAQSLYSEAQSLVKPQDRATYLTELGHVSALLAYTSPENSSMAVYLTQDRRDAIAVQLESAILYRTNRLPISRIELYTRYTSAIWALCHDWELKVPPVSRWPAGVKLPTSEATSHKTPMFEVYNKSTTDLPSKKPERNTIEVACVPRFDLAEFLNSKS